MAKTFVPPPWDFLREASLPSLESYELSRLNRAANIRREMGALVDQWIETASQAQLARWILEERSRVHPAEQPPETSLQPGLPFHEPAPSERAVRAANRLMRLSRRARDTAAD